jgi:two-component system response regulator AtoC
MGTILVIDDEQLVRWSIEKLLSKNGHEVISVETGAEGLLKLKDSTPDLILLDMKLPDINGMEILRTIKKDNKEVPVIIITAYGSIDSAIDAIKTGAFDYVVKPFDAEKLKLTVNRALELSKLKTELELFKDSAHHQYGFHSIVAESAVIKNAIEIAKKLAASDSTVLIQGESGTGKELFARAIHCASPRQERAFIALNCSAIPTHLIESELFGYEKGAFTDAKTSKKGMFELADKGTLFLDEIGDMDLSIQAKLLRAIETKSFKRLGGTKDITVDVRIISATNKDLKKLVEKGAFRDDLYYRINVVPLVIPPLRKRKEDIPLLVDHFIMTISRDLKKEVIGIEKEALEYLIRYDWPGNIRELKNVIERMILLTNDKILKKEFVPMELMESANNTDTDQFTSLELEKVEKELIIKALSLAEGNQTKAAQALSISRDALRYRMKKYNIK